MFQTHLLCLLLCISVAVQGSTDSLWKKNTHPYIVNGAKAPSDEFNFLAYLASESSACTGSVISDQYILTAAHCDGLKVAYVGDHDLKRPNVGQLIEFESFTPHPEYDDKVTANDIAIVKLKEKITHPKVKTVVLSDDESFELAGGVATLAGWGRTDINDKYSASPDLLYTNNTIVHWKACRDMISKHYFTVAYNSLTSQQKHTFDENYRLESTVCGGKVDMSSPGQGDSGGPFFLADGGLEVQIGVTSWTFVTKETQYLPSSYASVSYARDFIDRHAAGHVWYSQVRSPSPDSSSKPTSTQSTSAPIPSSAPGLYLGSAVAAATLGSMWLLLRY